MNYTEKAIEILDKFEQYTKGSLRDSEINNIMPILKEALQEKAERETGCATCNKPSLFMKQHKFPCCPMCGRKLGENK